MGGTSLVGGTSLGANKVTVVVNEKSPHRLRNLNMQFPVGGAIWGGYGTFRWCSLAGGNTSLRMSFEGSEPHSEPHSTVSLCCVFAVKDQITLSFLLLGPGYHVLSRQQRTNTLTPLLWLLERWRILTAV